MKEPIFLRSFKFVEEHVCFEKDTLFEFRPGINLLVGDQGSGKSTLLKCLNPGDSFDRMKYIIDADRVETYYLDTEKQNPRVIGNLDNAQPGTIGHVVSSFFMSHGETMFPRVSYVKKIKGSVVFIDEPEAGLSIRSQIKLVEIFAEASKHNQLIIATHSPYLITSMDEVFDMEDRKWKKSSDFLMQQVNGR